jgi:NADPH:quinone reductase
MRRPRRNPVPGSSSARSRSTPRSKVVPATMKAAALDGFGPPSVVRMKLVPVPPVGPHEVLIAVDGAGLGIWYAKIRDGSWAEDGVTFPLILGVDGAGVVAARGRRVTRFRAGDRVYSYQYDNPKGGFHAEYVAVKATHTARVPRSLGPLEAAALPAPGLTALQGIADHLRLRRGERVLIFGATGTVGTLAVQLAKQRGAFVVATATGRRAQTLVRELGADAVIDARRADARARLAAAAPEGLDAALVLAGARSLERCLQLVRPGGRIAYPNGVEPEPRGRPKVRRLPYDAMVSPRHFARLEKAIERSRLQVPIAAGYPLPRAAAAHARQEKRGAPGRIVIAVRPAR